MPLLTLKEYITITPHLLLPRYREVKWSRAQQSRAAEVIMIVSAEWSVIIEPPMIGIAKVGTPINHSLCTAYTESSLLDVYRFIISQLCPLSIFHSEPNRLLLNHSSRLTGNAFSIISTWSPHLIVPRASYYGVDWRQRELPFCWWWMHLISTGRQRQLNKSVDNATII